MYIVAFHWFLFLLIKNTIYSVEIKKKIFSKRDVPPDCKKHQSTSRFKGSRASSSTRPNCGVLELLDCLLFWSQDLACPGAIRGSFKEVRSVWSKLFKRSQPVSSKEIRTILLIQRCRRQSTAVECTRPGVPAINWEKIKVAFRVTPVAYSWVLFGPRNFWQNAIAKASTSGTSLSHETLGRFFVVLFSVRTDPGKTSPSPSTERIRTEPIVFFFLHLQHNYILVAIRTLAS